MNRIIKKRKVVNGVKITLLEKGIVSKLPIVDDKSKYIELKNEITTYVNDKIEKINLPTIITDIQKVVEQQYVPQLLSYTLTKDEILGVVNNTPEDGSILSYDSQNEDLVWRQSPSVRFDLIDNKLNNYPHEFRSDFVASNRFYMPFAVRSPVTGEIWGGNGKGGIFWGDPWLDPMDNFSIKFGHDDASIGETGYTYGTVGLIDPNHTPVVMKFSNGTEGGRGFVWAAHGNGKITPVMSLDTDDPDVVQNAGSLKVKGGITAERGNLSVASGSATIGDTIFAHGMFQTSYPSSGAIGPIFLANKYHQATANTIITIFSDLLYDEFGAPNGFSIGPEHNNYVMTYTHQTGRYGKISLQPPTGGSGSSTMYSTSGGVIDCGSFLSTDGIIDCGSFI